MIVNSITGFSASVRKHQKVLPKFLGEVFKGWEDVGINNYYSSNKDCIIDSIKFLNYHWPEDALLVGKSLGGIKTWWLLNAYWHHIEGRLEGGSKVGVVLLDPHGWQIGDGYVGSFGIGDRNLPWNKQWDKWIKADLLKIEVLYQRNKYPMGAHFEGKDVNTKLPRNATHWNITDIDSSIGRLSEAAIVEMADWLLK